MSSKNAGQAEMSDLTGGQEIVMKQVCDNQGDEVLCLPLFNPQIPTLVPK